MHMMSLLYQREREILPDATCLQYDHDHVSWPVYDDVSDISH
jgi:hypothetical protein